jgi:phage tail protein X
MIAVAQDGETLDAVCWRVLGRTAGVAEQAYELNPGLADLGPLLPGGTQIILPDVVAASTATTAAAPVRRETVKLWD